MDNIGMKFRIMERRTSISDIIRIYLTIFKQFFLKFLVTAQPQGLFLNVGFARLKRGDCASYENAKHFHNSHNPLFLLPKGAIQAQHPGRAEKIQSFLILDQNVTSQIEGCGVCFAGLTRETHTPLLFEMIPHFLFICRKKQRNLSLTGRIPAWRREKSHYNSYVQSGTLLTIRMEFVCALERKQVMKPV